MKSTPLEPGCYYHVYSHGIANRNIFIDSKNYEYFLYQYQKYIDAIADTFAWALMPNHFHFLIRIREKNDVVPNPDRVLNPVRGKQTGNPSHQFSKLLNSYAQALNKWSKMRGPLFQRPFCRKQIVSNEYLKSALIYIHNNPVHHGFCDSANIYHWTSYNTYIDIYKRNKNWNEVIGWFDNLENFIYAHNERAEITKMIDWLGLE